VGGVNAMVVKGRWDSETRRWEGDRQRIHADEDGTLKIVSRYN